MSQNRPPSPRTAKRIAVVAREVVARPEPRPVRGVAAGTRRCPSPAPAARASGRSSPWTKPSAWSASGVPSLSKSASLASQPQPLRESPSRSLSVAIRGDPLAHPRRLARAQEGEMALLQGELGGDVADEDVEDAVAVQVAEVDPHALERVAADHLGVGRGQRLLPLQQGEPELAGPRPVVQQPVGAEVVGEVDLGQEVAVEVGGPDRQGPTVVAQAVAARPRPRRIGRSARTRRRPRSSGGGASARRCRPASSSAASPPARRPGRRGSGRRRGSSCRRSGRRARRRRGRPAWRRW